MSPLGPSSGRRPHRAAFVIAAILAAAGTVLIAEGARIPARGGYAGVGPGDIPVLVGWGLVALALWHVVAGLRGGRGPGRVRQDAVAILWITGGLVLQNLLLWQAGFAIASGIVFAFTAAAFGRRNFAVSLPAGILLALLVYGIFDRLLKLNLPAGPLETLVFGG
jgi:putative tricarboxylic transport membrane protein